MDRQSYMKDYRAAYRQRTRDIRITLTAEQFSALRAAAKSEHTTPTGLGRQLITAGLSRDIRVPAAVASELKSLEFLVRNIANNINQLAHHANTVRMVIDPVAVLAELRRLDAVIRTFVTERLK